MLISYRFLYWCNLILGWSIDQIGDLIRYLHLLRGQGVPWIQCMESKEVPQQPWRASPQQIQVLKAQPLEVPKMIKADYYCVAHSLMGLIPTFKKERKNLPNPKPPILTVPPFKMALPKAIWPCFHPSHFIIDCPNIWVMLHTILLILYYSQCWVFFHWILCLWTCSPNKKPFVLL